MSFGFFGCLKQKGNSNIEIIKTQKTSTTKLILSPANCRKKIFVQNLMCRMLLEKNYVLTYVYRVPFRSSTPDQTGTRSGPLLFLRLHTSHLQPFLYLTVQPNQVFLDIGYLQMQPTIDCTAGKKSHLKFLVK